MSLMWDAIKQGASLNSIRLATKELKNLNLKPVKSIVFSFDPFSPGNGLKSLREFMSAAYGPDARNTNPSCRLKVDVRNDRSPPLIEAKLDDGRLLRILTDDLTPYHVAKMYNKYVPEHVPPRPWYEIYHEEKIKKNLKDKARRRVIKWWKF